MNFDNLIEELKEYRREEILFVGLGNRYRGDDGAGLVLLEEIRKHEEFSQSKFIQAGRNPENHLSEIIQLKPGIVIFIDAADFSEEPGSISFLSSEQINLLGISTHAFSIKLIEKFLLNERQMEFRYLAIQPQSKELCEEISIAVSDSIKDFFMLGV